MQTAIEKLNDIKKQYPHWIFNEEPKNANDRIIGHCEKHNVDFSLCTNAFPKQGGCPHCMKRQWIGIFTKSKILSLIEEMDLHHMDEFELGELISQHKLSFRFDSLRKTKPGSKERLKTIEELKKSIQNDTSEEIEEESTCNESNNDGSSNEIEISNKDEKDVMTMDAIINSIESTGCCMGTIFGGEKEKALLEHNFQKIWKCLLKADESGQVGTCIGQFTLKPSLSKWFDYVRNAFMDEYNAVMSVKKDDNCCFYEPNLMQKLMVYKCLNHQNYGNWCGTGTGKSFARDLISRKMDARVSLYIVPNGTINQVKEELEKKHYNDSIVLVPKHPQEVVAMNTNHYNYILLNYDKFNQPNTSEWIETIVSKNPKIDYICLDEVQNVKVRDDKNASSRYNNVLAFVTKIREMNNNVKVIAMSATSIVINLTEVVMLLKLLTGYDYSNDIGKQFTYGNAHNAYKALMLNGFRYLKSYDEIKQTNNGKPIFVEIDDNGVLDEFAEIIKNKSDIIGIERLLMPLRLEAIKNYLSEGTVFYTQYVDSGKFIPMIQKFVNANSELTSISYTGVDDKEIREQNLEKFKNGSVDTMILSSTGSTGLDGLQKKSHQIIALSLPWTAAEMQQLKGRILRTGYKAGKPVQIVIPQVVFTLSNGEKYSWDKDKWNVIEKRKIRMDMVMDADFSSVKDYDEKKVRQILLDKATKALEKGLTDSDVVREKIKSFNIEIIEKEKNFTLSAVNEIHRIANTVRPENIQSKCYGSSDNFKEYHRKRREAIQNNWVSDPLDKVAEVIKSYKTKVYENVIDLGCGENLLKTKITDGKKVVGVDVEKIDDTVIQANCANLKDAGIEDESFQIAVHCLSLWGNSYMEYIKEDYRILEGGMNAVLIIVEPSEKFGENEHYGTIDEFIANVESAGFKKNGNPDDIDGKFKMFQFTK